MLVLSDDVARRLLQVREALKLTRKDVSQRLEDLGLRKITPAALNNIETGRRDEAGRRRREVTVDELIDLAIALQVSPSMLVAPLGTDERVELMPGRTDDPWTTYLWLIGEFPTEVLGIQRDPEVIYRRSDDSGKVVATYRKHYAALHGYLTFRAQNPEAASRQLRSIAAARIEMHRAGWPPPTIPDAVRPLLDAPLKAWGYVADGDKLTPVPEIEDAP